MRGEALAALTGGVTGYVQGLLATGYAEKSVYLGNQIVSSYLPFYSHPAEATIANAIVFAIIFACCYNIAKNTGQIVQYAHLYELRRRRSNRIDR